MKEFIKKNFAILLAFILPIALIVIVALSTYLPSMFISTDYDFVYTACADGKNYYPYTYNCDYYLKQRYTVVDNKLVLSPVDLTKDVNGNLIPAIPEGYGKYSDRIFYHDTTKNESKEITSEEAQAMKLSGLLTSPDGVTVSGHYSNGGGGFFLFGGGQSSYGQYITKGNSRSKLNLINSTDAYYYQNNFQFVGWVLNK